MEPANLAERYLGLSLQETIQEKAEDLQEDDLTAPFFNMAAMVWLVFFCAALLLARDRGGGCSSSCRCWRSGPPR